MGLSTRSEALYIYLCYKANTGSHRLLPYLQVVDLHAKKKKLTGRAIRRETVAEGSETLAESKLKEEKRRLLHPRPGTLACGEH